MSGIIAVYALVVAVLIAGSMKPPPEGNYTLFHGCLHLACGLSVGLTGLAAGYAIGIVGDSVGGAISRARWRLSTDSGYREYARTCNSRAFLWEWFSYSFSGKYWDCTGKSGLMGRLRNIRN